MITICNICGRPASSDEHFNYTLGVCSGCEAKQHDTLPVDQEDDHGPRYGPAPWVDPHEHDIY